MLPGVEATVATGRETASRISCSPVSAPMGLAPARQSLMTLYCAGLWLAVNIAPGRPRSPEAKYSWSVDASPIISTSAPASAAPVANAAARAGEVGRMSCPTTIADAAQTRTNAAPVRRASSSSIWSGTVPRTSYALKTACVFAGSVVLTGRGYRPGSARPPSLRGEHAQVPAAPCLAPGAGGHRGCRGTGRLDHRPPSLTDRGGPRHEGALGPAGAAG